MDSVQFDYLVSSERIEYVGSCRSERIQWKKCSEETQTLRVGCSKAEPKISPRRRTPLPGRGTAKI